jgi:hypothetical protein
MSDRAWLSLFSIVMILAGLGGAVWLIITGQALTMDGLFLLLVALLVALVFALYVKFLIRTAMEAGNKPAAPAKAGATAPAAAKRTPTPAATQQAQ